MSTLSFQMPSRAASAAPLAGFQAYLERSLRDPFTLNLKDYPLMDVIKACVKARSKLHPGYKTTLACLVYNLKILEREYDVRLQPVQVTDIFWDYFISFCVGRGLRASSINTLCNQLRSILNWAVKYNATVSPTYADFRPPVSRNMEVALTSDDVSRIAYFDIDRFYAARRSDYRRTMGRVRDMFVLNCNLGVRHSDMVRVEPSCFERNLFKITQQKTGCPAVVNIDRFSLDPKTTYRLLDKYGRKPPYTAAIGNYNFALHHLMRDIGFDDIVRVEEKRNGVVEVENIPKWKMISSHTARRTFITVNVLRGRNVHDIKRCSGHTDLRCFEKYVREE